MIDITPLIITFNERDNIVRSMEALSWAKEVLILDSGSIDLTLEIAQAAHPNVRTIRREFDSFAAQCNFGLTQIATEWVLSMDADYVLTPGLIAEIAVLEPASEVAGYSIEFSYCIYGRPLRATVYPPRVVLYRRDRAMYWDEGHGHRVCVEGRIERLRGRIKHDDRKSFARWLQSQERYSKIEAQHLLNLQRAQSRNCKAQLKFQDRVRLKVFFSAPAMFLYLLFARGLILDGWPGWFYVCQRTIAELLLSIRLIIETKNLE